MVFESLRAGTVGLVMSLTAAFNTSPQAVPPSGNQSLQAPVILASENLPSKIIANSSTPETTQNLHSLTSNEKSKIEMVTREVEAPPSQDVMFYTVTQPSPKPTPKSEENKEEVKDEKPEKNKEETEVKPAASAIPAPSASLSPSIPPVVLTSSNAERLFQMANDRRVKNGKAPFEKDERLCKMAEQRAPQINGELASGALHAGFKALNLPYWASENIAAYSTIEENFNFWVNDYIHRIAIDGDAKYSCVACSGASCSQIFSSFVQK